MRWLLIRHGESEGNREWRLQGQREYPMTDRGRCQSEALARRLARRPIAAIYSSPLRRAWDTATAIATALGLEVQTLPAVQEYDFGELSGLTWGEIHERAPAVTAAVVSRSPEYPHYPGEEGREAFRQRVCGALWELRERHHGETVAVVTHAGAVIAFLMDVLGRPYRRPIPFVVENGSITVVETLPEKSWPGAPAAVLVSLNDVCHLSGVGEAYDLEDLPAGRQGWGEG
jgi:broad specificity phosphatase PhoE